MAEFNLKLTQGGAILLAKAKLGKQLNFKYITLGSGVYEGNPQEATAFVNKVIDLNIQEKTRKDTVAFLKATLTYNAVPDGFVWTELGVIAIDPDTQEEVLYMYDAIDIGEVIPPATSATQIEKVIQVASYVSNAPNISVVIDESLINIPKSDIGQPNGVAPLNEDGVLDIQYGGTGAKTKKQACDNLDAMSAVCEYYSGSAAEGILDTTIESTVIVYTSQEVNKTLNDLLKSTWAFVIQTFYIDRSGDNARTQIAIGSEGKIACRHRDAYGDWKPWTLQATAVKPTEYVLALSDEFSPSGANKYFKTEDGVVTVSFNIIHNTSFIANGWGTVVATLPVGFRPNSLLCFPAIARKTDNTLISAMVGIKATGEIEFTVNSSDSLKNATASFSFIAGN